MDPQQFDVDPFHNDPALWAHSLRNLAEVMLPCLDAAGARSVFEVGAYAGDLTDLLAGWAERSGATVTAIDPSPQDDLVRLAESRPQVELVRETSLAALPRLTMPDAVIIDGDHNYFTVSEELRLVAERAGEQLPLLLFHDVCWPHGRRDDYFDPEQIPAEHRNPIARGGGVFPGDPGIRPGSLPYRAAAAREGGPRNGVLTAVEDFVEGRDDLALAIVPAFFGLGVVWSRSAPWAEAVAKVLEPWDRNPLLARLEGNRVFHLANTHVFASELEATQERLSHQEALLRRLLESRAFAVAERLSRVRWRAGVVRDHAAVTKEEILRALGERP